MPVFICGACRAFLFSGTTEYIIRAWTTRAGRNRLFTSARKTCSIQRTSTGVTSSLSLRLPPTLQPLLLCVLLRLAFLTAELRYIFLLTKSRRRGGRPGVRGKLTVGLECLPTWESSCSTFFAASKPRAAYEVMCWTKASATLPQSKVSTVHSAGRNMFIVYTSSSAFL